MIFMIAKVVNVDKIVIRAFDGSEVILRGGNMERGETLVPDSPFEDLEQHEIDRSRDEVLAAARRACMVAAAGDSYRYSSCCAAYFAALELHETLYGVDDDLRQESFSIIQGISGKDWRNSDAYM